MTSVRQFLNEHPPVVLVGLVVAAALFIWTMLPASTEAIRHIPTAYFYDLNTGELLILAADTEEPFETKSGPNHGRLAGVRAHVFTCGRCTEDERFVGWLEMPDHAKSEPVIDETAKPAKIDRAGESPPEPSRILIRSESDPIWVPYHSRAGRRIRDQVERRCGENQSVRYCSPPTKRAE